MSEPRSEDDGVLREWAPLSGLLREIPLTVRRGLFLENVTLTCVNAIQEYLAVGTNIGVVYWYHRESHSVQRLRPEKCGLPITCVKIASSVDYMVAAGDKGGTVTVFRIPKPTPDWLPPSYKHNTNTNVERYTVGGLHMGPVSALEWSMNGQKLFSGDTLGIVVYTEIDFYMNLSKAYEILNEKYCIVQLSFNHHCQTLLVATEYRCILAYQQESWKVVQVGQKERRSLCHVGATFSPQASRPLEPLVYSGRAGLRFWQADKEGTVHKTIIFKDAVKNPHPTIRLLRPRPVCTPVCDGDMGLLLPWRGNLLVTHSSCTLLVLDPQQISVVASLSGLTNLHSIAVTQNEIFIIEGARNIARFAYTPDVFHVNTGSESIANMPMSLLDMSVAPVAGTLMDLTNKLKETASKLVTNNPGHTINGIQDNVSAASEATELDLPPVVPLTDSSVEELTVKVDPRIEVLDQIGKQSFDDILYNSERKGSRRSRRQSSRSKNHNNNSSVTEVSPSTESNSDTVSVASIHSNTSTDFAVEDVTPMQQTNNNNNNNNNVNNNNNDNNNPSSDNLQPDLHLNLHENSETTHEIPFDIQPDLRSPGTILKELHDKEILVAKALNLEEVLLADDNSKKQDNVCVAEISNNIDSRDKEEKENKPNQEDCEENSLDCDTESSDKEQSSDVRFGDPREHISDLSYGPPSGSSSAQLSLEVSTHPLAQEYSHLEEEKDDSITHYNGGWRKIPCPETALYIEVCSDYVCVSGPGLSIHCSRLENGSMHWQKLKYRAVLLALSPSAQVVWKLDFRVAHALTDPDRIGPYGSVWEVAARNVESVALDDTVAWYISDGKIYLQAGLSKSEPFKKPQPIASPSPTTKVSKICCSQHVLWILTSDGEVFRRVGITDDCVEGNSWLRVNIPNGKKIGSIALGPKNTGWIVNRNNCIFFSDNYTEETPEWWQVLINNYVFEKTSLCQITANHNSVWVTNKVASFVQMNNTDIKGHQWLPVSLKTTSPSIKWKQVTAEGVFEDKGSIWLLSTSADLYHMCPSMNLCELVSLPCHGEDIRSLAAAPHALWLLTQYGHIYIRQGINDSCPKGNKWRQLNLEQINKKVTLCHVSCGCDVVWACDTKGDVYMVVGSPYTIATDTFSPAWVPVEDNPLPNTMFTKVFVGSETHMVWALDNKNNVYVREGIFPDFQLGTGWFPVPGLSATSLSISGSAVWALSPDGSIYRRCCISQNNYVGNYWIQVPGSLSVLTASVSNDLWGITGLQGSLQVYSQKTVYLNKDAELKMYSSLKDDDWEVI